MKKKQYLFFSAARHGHGGRAPRRCRPWRRRSRDLTGAGFGPRSGIPFTGGGLGGGRPGAVARPVRRPATPSRRRSRKARMEAASGRAWGPESGAAARANGGRKGVSRRRDSGLGFRLRGWLGVGEYRCGSKFSQNELDRV
jgi:hypothetical protein